MNRIRNKATDAAWSKEVINDAEPTTRAEDGYGCFESRSDAQLAYLFGVCSIVLCISIIGSPFAIILALAAKKLAAITEEDFSSDKKGAKGMKLARIGFILGIVIFSLTVVVAGIIWLRLKLS